MPVIEGFLSDEEKEAYKEREATSPEKNLMARFKGQVPSWRDSFEVMRYQKATSSPEAVPDLLALNVFDKDMGGANARRSRDNMGLSYIKPDGSFNMKQWSQDSFVTDLERAFYANRGEVPLEFFLDHAEDLALMGPEYAEATKTLFDVSQIEASRVESRQRDRDRFNNIANVISKHEKVGRDVAQMVWTDFDKIYRENFLPEDDELFSSQDTIGGPGMMDAREAKKRRQAGAAARVQARLDERFGEGQIDGKALITLYETMRAKDGMRDPEKIYAAYENPITGGATAYEQAEDIVEGFFIRPVGTAFGAVTNVLGWAVDKAFPTYDETVVLTDGLLTVSDTPSAAEEAYGKRAEQIQQLEDTLGMSTLDFALKQGMGDDLGRIFREELPQIDPDTYNTMLAMAGGDEGLAESFYVDSIINQKAVQEEIEKQRAIYESKVNSEIQDLEDFNFTAADALNNLIGYAGEAVNYLATGVTLAISTLAAPGDTPPIQQIFSKQFLQDVHDAKTPSGALGLEGTLLGLVFDLVIPALVDPVNIPFGPSLSTAAGRYGAAYADDALRMARAPGEVMMADDAMRVLRGHSENAVPTAVVLDALDITDSGEVFAAATRGSANPITSSRSYMDTPLANVTEDVSFKFLEPLYQSLDDATIAPELLEATREVIKNGDATPVEITINPETGMYGITKGAETGPALASMGFDAIPTTFKVDPAWGLDRYVADQAVRSSREFAFHGSPAAFEGKLLSGGLSENLDMALTHAGDDGYIYLTRKGDLPVNIQEGFDAAGNVYRAVDMSVDDAARAKTQNVLSEPGVAKLVNAISLQADNATLQRLAREQLASRGIGVNKINRARANPEALAMVDQLVDEGAIIKRGDHIFGPKELVDNFVWDDRLLMHQEGIPVTRVPAKDVRRAMARRDGVERGNPLNKELEIRRSSLDELLIEHTDSVSAAERAEMGGYSRGLEWHAGSDAQGARVVTDINREIAYRLSRGEITEAQVKAAAERLTATPPKGVDWMWGPDYEFGARFTKDAFIEQYGPSPLETRIGEQLEGITGSPYRVDDYYFQGSVTPPAQFTNEGLRYGGLVSSPDYPATFNKPAPRSANPFTGEPASAATAGEHFVYIFDRADFPPAVRIQSRIEAVVREGLVGTGEDIATRIPDGIQPVAYFDTATGKVVPLTISRRLAAQPAPRVLIAEWAKGVPSEGTLNIEGSIYKRPSRILDKETILDAPNRAQLQEIMELHLLMGGDPISGSRLPTAISMGQLYGDIVRNSPSKILKYIDNYMQAINTNIKVDHVGVGAKAALNQRGARMWSSARDIAGWEPFQARINNFYAKIGEARLKSAALSERAAQLTRQIKAMKSFVGGSLDDWIERIGITDDATRTDLAARHRNVMDEVAKVEAQLEEVSQLQRDTQGQMTSYSELNKIIEEMDNEFNRTHIATRKDWAEFVDPETGMVPWNIISGRPQGTSLGRLEAILKRAKESGISLEEAARGELGVIPEDVAAVLDMVTTLDMNVNTFIDDALNALSQPTSYVAPASPLEMMTAAASGPSTVAKVSKRIHMENIGEYAMNAQMYWALDKVITPRTAIVVSADEVVRLMQAGGYKTVLKYMEDKAMGLTERVTRIKGGPHWERLPQRWKDRIVALEEYPVMYRQLERSFLETNGVGFDAISIENAGRRAYLDAAQRSSGQILTDIGFQKYLEGPEAFAKWFAEETTASRVRDMQILDASSGASQAGATLAQVTEYYDTLMNDWILSKIKPEKRAKALEIWKEAAAKQAAKESTAGGAVALPDWVLEGWGTVTGNAPVNAKGMGIFNYASERLFQGPVNYRRGFAAEQVRQAEHVRLEKLFSSQGKRVISNEEFLRRVRQRYPDLAESELAGRSTQLQQELFKQEGVLSQGYVERLVESKVVTEMEKILYSFQMNSRAGRALKGVFPFGKAWADMWAHWGRTMVERPRLRGWGNAENYGNLRRIAESATDRLPFNPKPAAFVSRIAATDFDLDRIGDDPIVGGIARAMGLEELDLGPVLFLPHGGDNPFSVILPGLGVVPTAALQGLFNATAPDPVEDPLGYQQMVDQWSQFVPSLGYNNSNTLLQFVSQAVLGGGTLSKAEQAYHAVEAYRGKSAPSADPLSGSWKSRVASNRQVKLLFQNPDIWEEFADLPPAIGDVGLTAFLDSQLAEVIDEGQNAQALDQLKEIGLEFAVPSRATFNSQNDQLNEVWLDSVDWMGLEMPKYFDTSKASGQAQAAEWARTQFFARPDWERDALLVEHPGMAVNVVSMWKWSDRARESQQLGRQVSSPYRSGGSATDRARHDTYITRGYIEPTTPAEMAQNIIGTVVNARVQTARSLYMEAAAAVNEQRWEYMVSPEWKDWLDEIAPVIKEEGLLPYETGRELWENYSDLKRVYDQLYPPKEGETGFSIPQKQRAWSEDMPSSPEALRGEFEEGYPLPYQSDKMVREARALGLNLTPAREDGDEERPIEMAEIYALTANAIADGYLDNPIYAHVAEGYKAWAAPRSAGYQATAEYLGRVLDSDSFDPDKTFEYKQVSVWIDEAQARRTAGDKSWLRIRDEAAARFSRMLQDDAFKNTNAEQLWNQAWGKSLGALDWTPDEPAPLKLESGDFNPEASQVYVKQVVDGDTIDVSFGRRGLTPGEDFYRVRLLGYNADELGSGGEPERDKLRTAIQDAIQKGMPISIVRDPRYGNTDMYGRVFGWLYIGDEVWYDPSTMIPRNN